MFSKLFCLLMASTLLPSCTGTRPSFVNKQNELAPCPQTPNCVSTLSSDTLHLIAPLSYKNDANSAMKKLVKIISSMERTVIVTKTENYLYAEFTSKLWRFVDDVEFLFDTANKTIHFRSSSRIGKSDLGVNRKRMEFIRQKFNE